MKLNKVISPTVCFISLTLHYHLVHVSRKYKTDFDIIRENHKFLWEDEDEPSSWEEELAKKYYDKLFKEYCIADLTYYKDGQVNSEAVFKLHEYRCALLI